MQATIYQIRNEKNECESYVGSTKNFKRRRRLHKSVCKNPKDKGHNYPVYQFIRANGGWDEFEMIKLFDVTVKNKKQLHKIERQAIEDYGGTLNTTVPGRTGKEYMAEYREKNREKYRELAKKSYEKNKEKIKSIREEKVECECGSITRRGEVSRHMKSKKHQNFTKSV